jgi:hypothetical protein
MKHYSSYNLGSTAQAEVCPLSWNRAFWAASGYSLGSSLSHKITKLHETRRGLFGGEIVNCDSVAMYREFETMQYPVKTRVLRGYVLFPMELNLQLQRNQV